MRALAALLFILTIFLFSYLFCWHYGHYSRDKLITQALTKLEGTGFDHIKLLQPDGMDIELWGQVPHLGEREHVRDDIDDVWGLRAPEPKNFILAPGLFETIYDEDDAELTIAGSVGEQELKDSLVARIQTLLKDRNVKVVDKMMVRQTIESPVFLKNPKFRQLLDEVYLNVPEPASIKADADGIELKGDTTRALMAKWRETIDEISDDIAEEDPKAPRLNISGDLNSYASVYHMPGYYRQSSSGLRRMAFDNLRAQLQEYQVYFDSGKWEINEFDAGMMENIRRLSEIIKAQPASISYVLGGHADSTGSYEANKILSEKRARSVRDWLVFDGVSPEQLSVVSFGTVRPTGNQQTAAGRSQSRRVEAVIK